jgi:membrane fusion protein (multidrug efflux system)
MADYNETQNGGKNMGQRPQAEPVKPQKPTARWPWFVAGAVVLCFIAILLLIIFLPHRHEKTDDAYVAAHFATVAPRVPGQVASVVVGDNQAVQAGQIVATLDDRDYRTALDQAQAALEIDIARVDQARAQVARQPSLIRQAVAQVASATAKLDLSNADAARFANLAKTGAGTVQQHQQADTVLRQDHAAGDSAQADLSAARHQLDALRADLSATLAKVQQDRAQLEQAQLNLSYTRILAPIDGLIDQRAVQVGDFVGPGMTMMVTVPLHQVYILANYQEQALRHMRPGQPVQIHLDAYDIKLTGVVDSLPPASGAAYSPIPPTNGTGNFTKIVQRLPVKIVLAPNQPLATLLRVGMSVETTVDTKLDDVVAAQRHSGDHLAAYQ